MRQGASGVADCEGLVSPAYVVLQPKKRIDPLYASHLFKTKRMVYLFWAYSYGITEDRLRLYFHDFMRVPVVIPPIREQKRIASILATWERWIAESKALLINKVTTHSRLLKLLTTGQRHLGHSQGAWRDFTLGELGEPYGGLTGKTQASFGRGKPYIPYKNKRWLHRGHATCAQASGGTRGAESLVSGKGQARASRTP